MQRDEKQLDNSLEATIQRVQDLKGSLSALLVKLETEYTLNWPSVLDSFALLSGQISSLNKLLKHEKTPLLRNYVLLPLLLSPDRDADLEKLTEGRVLAFNHEVVPDYLRTKPEPDVEERQQHISKQASNMTVENAQKQMNAVNRISTQLLDMITSFRDEWELAQKTSQQQTSSIADTNTLLAAVNFGKGLKSGSENVHSSQSQPSPAEHAQPGRQASSSMKAPSSIKTNIKSASSLHPYQR
ncbi:mediator of RNA polymerase II transcription subunit 8-B [Lingula anatina]|uniref:Mediator of RNA polymerase II transcription subunit 8 n=1 Tax=Lingula anatina TaxID=7574 RepID=A0A1S3JA24_LINAN|nr:mediator of RNA polymerase II transcription subunit 8-B [Lingula anatina]|eukprot:XP_013407255.1 mediator of RNA polymerase II transcription subunit 8-B [Lingula anatina]